MRAEAITLELLEHEPYGVLAELRATAPVARVDAIGGWRDYYEGNVPIDSSGALPGGDAFRTVSEFRQLLVDRQDQFNRCLTEKLMTYALGRGLGVGDRPAIDEILTELQKQKGGLRDLIRLIVLSEPFLGN